MEIIQLQKELMPVSLIFAGLRWSFMSAREACGLKGKHFVSSNVSIQMYSNTSFPYCLSESGSQLRCSSHTFPFISVKSIKIVGVCQVYRTTGIFWIILLLQGIDCSIRKILSGYCLHSKATLTCSGWCCKLYAHCYVDFVSSFLIWMWHNDISYFMISSPYSIHLAAFWMHSDYGRKSTQSSIRLSIRFITEHHR